VASRARRILAVVGLAILVPIAACVAYRPRIDPAAQDGQSVADGGAVLRYGVAVVDGADVELWFSNQPIPCEHHLLYSRLGNDELTEAIVVMLPPAAQRTGGPYAARTRGLYADLSMREDKGREASTVSLDAFSTLPGAHVRGTMVLDAEGGWRPTKSAIGGGWSRRGGGKFDVRVCTRVGLPTLHRLLALVEKGR